MGWLDDAWDSVEDAAGAVADVAAPFVEPFIEPIVEVVETFVAPVVDAVEETGGWFETVVEDAGTWALETADDVGVFSAVEFVTGGIVDVGYTDGQFTANVDIGIASAGIGFGDQGFEANYGVDVGIASASVDVDESGFEVEGSAGVDWGPLPYVEGHVNIDENGTIEVDGRAQATIPTPWGIVDGEVEGGFHQLPDGSWGAYGGAEGTLITPAGVTVSAGGEVSYEREADGDEVFTAGGHVGVGILGGPSIEVGGEYHSIEDNGTYTEGGSGYVEGEGYGLEVRAEGSYESVTDAEGNITETYAGSVEGSGYGVEVGAQGSYESVENIDGTSSETYSGSVEASGYGQEIGAGASYSEQTSADGTTTTSSDAWVDVDGLDTDALIAKAGSLIGDQVGDLPGAGAVSDTISNLAGDGDLSDVLSGMAQDAGSSIADVAGDLAESGNFDDFSSDVISSEVSEAAADGAWDDLLE